MPYLIVDDFLASERADHLLEQMIAARPDFTPSTVGKRDDATHDAAFRSSLRLPGRIGVDLTGLVDAIHVHFEAICAATGMQHFTIERSECSIVAHGDGDFYRRHVDTDSGHPRHVRIISCVYYLHRRPRVFTGGELAIHSLLSDGATAIIEPIHNRLVAFPSFVPHEVLPIASPGGFDASRFSVSCWLHRAVRPTGAMGEGK